MCGRYALGVPLAELQAQVEDGYEMHIGEWINQDQFFPRYNIAPRSNAPVIRRQDTSQQGSSSTSTEQVVMQTMKWGLVPHWSKHEDKTLNTTNARSENLVEGGGMWGSIKGKKRCAILCEGYYEWLKKGKDRLPHFTKHKTGRLMLLAGLYDCVTLEGQSEPLWTFTIVTTSANKEFSWLHDRQPVILSTHDALTTWLDTSSQSWTSTLTKLVEPYHDDKAPLVCYQVPKEVGKVGVESATFIQPITERKDGIQAMFAKQANASGSGSQPSTPSKGKKRDLDSSPEPQAKTGSGNRSPNKKLKIEKLDAWEDSSEIELLDTPPQSQAPKGTQSSNAPKLRPSKAKSSPKKQPKGKGSSKSKGTKEAGKITAFFKK